LKGPFRLLSRASVTSESRSGSHRLLLLRAVVTVACNSATSGPIASAATIAPRCVASMARLASALARHVPPSASPCCSSAASAGPIAPLTATIDPRFQLPRAGSLALASSSVLGQRHATENPEPADSELPGPWPGPRDGTGPDPHQIIMGRFLDSKFPDDPDVRPGEPGPVRSA